MSINAEIKNFVQQLRKTNAQHKTRRTNYVKCNNETHYPEIGLRSLDTTPQHSEHFHSLVN